MNGYFITGTDTDVGKTVVTACLATLFKSQGVDVGDGLAGPLAPDQLRRGEEDEDDVAGGLVDADVVDVADHHIAGSGVDEGATQIDVLVASAHVVKLSEALGQGDGSRAKHSEGRGGAHPTEDQRLESLKALWHQLHQVAKRLAALVLDKVQGPQKAGIRRN